MAREKERGTPQASDRQGDRDRDAPAAGPGRVEAAHAFRAGATQGPVDPRFAAGMRQAKREYEARAQRDVTQEEIGRMVAERLGRPKPYSVQVVSYWFQGRVPRYVVGCAIAQVLGADPLRLAGLTPRAPAATGTGNATGTATGNPGTPGAMGAVGRAPVMDVPLSSYERLEVPMQAVVSRTPPRATGVRRRRSGG